MKTLSKVVTFQKQKDLCILHKNSGDDTLNLCYVPPSLQLLGLTTPQFSNLNPRSPSFQTRLTPLVILNNKECKEMAKQLLYNKQSGDQPFGPLTRTVSWPAPAPAVSTTKWLLYLVRMPCCRPGPRAVTLLASGDPETFVTNGLPTQTKIHYHSSITI